MRNELAKKPGCLGILATALFVILILWCFWLHLEIKYQGAKWDHRTESSFWSIVDLEDAVEDLEQRIEALEQQAEQGGD